MPSVIEIPPYLARGDWKFRLPDVKIFWHFIRLPYIFSRTTTNLSKDLRPNLSILIDPKFHPRTRMRIKINKAVRLDGLPREKERKMNASTVELSVVGWMICGSSSQAPFNWVSPLPVCGFFDRRVRHRRCRIGVNLTPLTPFVPNNSMRSIVNHPSLYDKNTRKRSNSRIPASQNFPFFRSFEIVNQGIRKINFSPARQLPNCSNVEHNNNRTVNYDGWNISLS